MAAMAGHLIRLAVEHEARLLSDLALRSKAHWGYDGAFLEQARRELIVDEQEIHDGKVCVAERNGRILGFSVLHADADPPELTALFVDPDVIGHGVGAALLRHQLSRARCLGVAALIIESDPNAEPFYRTQGAIREGCRRSQSTGRELPVLRIRT